ncbi:MAG: cysteine synthase A [Hydrogenibacillus schlegelii]|nr:cysteine synthase A [Hydrogenibacillus schlegelii]
MRAAHPAVVDHIYELIGGTPLVKLNRLVTERHADVYVKLEYFNPSGSVKDRAAYSMIKAAEEEGRIAPGKTTIIEPTSGNTGIGLAMVAAAKGYRCILVMPEGSTVERIKLLRAYGAEVVLTPKEKKMPGAVEKARELAAQIPDSFIPMQFENPANPKAHRETTAREILAQVAALGRRLDGFVATAGTGGTITGTGEVLKQVFPDLVIAVVEPKTSPVLSGGSPGPHKLVGTSPGFIPPILNRSIYDHIFLVEDDEAYAVTRRLAREEGILVGPSSGAAVFAALKLAEMLGPGKLVVSMTADTGERYLSSDVFPAD